MRQQRYTQKRSGINSPQINKQSFRISQPSKIWNCNQDIWQQSEITRKFYRIFKNILKLRYEIDERRRAREDMKYDLNLQIKDLDGFKRILMTIHNERFNELKETYKSNNLFEPKMSQVRRSHIIINEDEDELVNTLVSETIPIQLKAPMGSNIISHSGQAKIAMKPFEKLSQPNDSILQSLLNKRDHTALTNEQARIAKDIEEDMVQMSSIFQVVSPGRNKNQKQQFIDINEVQMKQQAQQIKKIIVLKKLQISSSQIINDKGQILITPIYYHVKYYFIILAIILIFIGLMIFRPHNKERKHEAQMHKDHHKRNQKGKKRKGNKNSHH